jgi:hypothetical protein
MLELNDEKLADVPFNLNDSFYRQLLLDSIRGLHYQLSEKKWNIWSFCVSCTIFNCLFTKKSVKTAAFNIFFKNIIFFIFFDKYPRLVLSSIYLFDSHLLSQLNFILDNGYKTSIYTVGLLFSRKGREAIFSTFFLLLQRTCLLLLMKYPSG